MDNKAEYKVISGNASECQKWLNQWKHEFKLNILAMSATDNTTTILLTREREGRGEDE